jgi:NAD dependent epimerase/dehydratase family enzyme
MEDVIQMYIFALEHPSIHGIYNMVAPHPTTNKIMTTTLAQLFKKLLWLPAIPAWVLKLVLGEMSVLALDSARVSSDKILSTGFKFKFSTIDSALRNIYLR